MGGFSKCWNTPAKSDLLDKERWKAFLAQVIPAGLDGSMQKISGSINVALAARLGMAQTAAFDILQQFVLIQYFVVWGLGQGFSVLMAQRLGARQPNRARGIVTLASFFLYGLLCALGLTFYFVIPHAANFSSHDPQVREEISNMTLFVSVNVVTTGGLSWMLDMFIKQGKAVFVITTITPCVWFIGVPISIILAPHLGLTGIFWGGAISYGLAHLIMLTALVRTDWVAVADQAALRSEAKED